MKREYMKSSLCWSCAKATNRKSGCPWVRDFTAVEGWEAEYRPAGNNFPDSYLVKKCPLFLSDAEILKEKIARREKWLKEDAGDFGDYAASLIRIEIQRLKKRLKKTED